MAIGTVLMFQIEQWLKRHEAKAKGDVLQELQKVADADPLKRIVAVRQLSCWLLQAPLDAGEEQAISDAFRLLLKQEQEAIVKDAALEGLQLLETLHPLKGSHKVSLLEEEML
ncbi:MAG: hypothetical protein HC925_03940 [Coleofasciculaceae cyanobacterium SM2_3_26]|nr:hypothetical protein [Coleofasciculaceae cyanobacterium SM2_3_26]